MIYYLKSYHHAYVKENKLQPKLEDKGLLDILIKFETLCCISPLEKLSKIGVDNLGRLYKKVFTVTFGTMYENYYIH